MLLIIILGLMAKLVLVSGDCDFGTLNMSDFDWTKFSGPRHWYVLLHDANDFENNIECSVATFESPEGNTSLVTSDVYDTREKRHNIFNGYATNWNSTGYFDIYHSVSIWNGRYYVIAIDYDRYFIAKRCSFVSNTLSIYVAYRSSRPDEATKNDALKALKDNNIDVDQLVKRKKDHCLEAESSTSGGSSP